MNLLQNKTALITGASRGIGRSTALLFAEEGANIIFTDLRENENSQSLVEEITAKGVKAMFIAANAADFDETMGVAEKVEKEFGRLDVLINNAGITRDNLLLRMSPSDWDAVIQTSARFITTAKLLPP